MIFWKPRLARIKKKGLQAVFRVSDIIFDSDKYIRYTHHKNGYHNPKYSFKKDQINFIHLPKTGGTSFCRMLEKDPQKRFVHLDIHRPVSKFCAPQDHKYITVLRNPIDRVWSQYQHVLRESEGYPYQKFAKQGLNRFLEKCWAVRNMACRYISGNVEQEPDQATLEKAIENLECFYDVLLFENFSTEVGEFLNRHQIPNEHIPNERKSEYAKPTNQEIELIRRYNQLDIAFFENWKSKKSIL